MNQSNAEMNRNTIRRIQSQPGDTGLELGMGNGHFIGELFDNHPGIRYIGCDYSTEMIEATRQNNLQRVADGSVQLHLCHASGIPLENDSVDWMFTVNTLYFWDQPEAVRDELKRIVKPGGKIWITIRSKETMESYPFTRFGFRMYNKEDLHNLLEGNGLHIVHIHEIQEENRIIEEKEYPSTVFIVEILVKNT